jgi:hypothetical protein
VDYFKTLNGCKLEKEILEHIIEWRFSGFLGPLFNNFLL